MSRRVPPSRPLQRLDQGRVGQKLKTRRRILSSASALVAAGKTPTVEQAADAAGVSRRTAYRYFPAQTKLLTEAELEGLRAPMEAMLAGAPPGAELQDLELRVGALIDRMQSMAIRNEGLLRTMIHQTVLESSPTGQLRRGTRRLDWIAAATEPLREQVKPAAYRRLVAALALCGGIEALLVLRDICGLPQQEAIAVSRWAAQSLLKQTIRESETTTRSTRKRSTRARPLASKRP